MPRLRILTDPVRQSASIPSFTKEGTNAWLKIALVSLLLLFLFASGCVPKKDPLHIVIWHQMRVDERLILADQLKQFMATHPGVKAEEIYKETEELRSGFIVAAIAGQGPDLVYGPRSEEHTSELQSQR